MIVSRPVIAYKTITSSDLEDLDRQVNEAIKDWWQPVEQAMPMVTAGGFSRFIQTMVRFAPKADEMDIDREEWRKIADRVIGTRK